MSSATLTLTEDHLGKLDDAALRAIALRILTDATNAFESNIVDLGPLGGLDNLIVAPAREAAAWLQAAMTNPADYDDTAWDDHYDAIHGLEHLANGICGALYEDIDEFSLRQNVVAVRLVFESVDDDGTVQRPDHEWIDVILDRWGGGFVPGHETVVGYVLNVICATDDPRLSALAESYMQSGLHANLQPAIDEATNQLVSIDELTELNH